MLAILARGPLPHVTGEWADLLLQYILVILFFGMISMAFLMKHIGIMRQEMVDFFQYATFLLLIVTELLYIYLWVCLATHVFHKKKNQIPSAPSSHPSTR